MQCIYARTPLSFPQVPLSQNRPRITQPDAALLFTGSDIQPATNLTLGMLRTGASWMELTRQAAAAAVLQQGAAMVSVFGSVSVGIGCLLCICFWYM